MLRHRIGCLLIAGALTFGMAAPASAQQTVNFTIGYDTVAGRDSRTEPTCSTCTDGDVLLADRRFLSFDISDFNSVTFGGEWLVALGRFVEAGAGISYASQNVPSLYTNYTRPNGAEIEQDHFFRRVPIDLTARLVPLGQTSPFQPYIGGGLTLVNWRYEETGDFIDFSGGGRTVYCVGPDAGCDPTYDSSGTDTGAIVLGGVRFAGRSGLTAGGEIRWRKATGTLDDSFAGVAEKIDLGGWTYLATIGMRFGG